MCDRRREPVAHPREDSGVAGATGDPASGRVKPVALYLVATLSVGGQLAERRSSAVDRHRQLPRGD